MNRKEKEVTVKQLHQNFNESNGAFLVNYKGLTVNQMQQLRKQLRDCGAKLKVAKDRLIKIAINDTPAKELESLLSDQLAVVFVEKDSSAAAKVVYDFSKESPVNLVAGVVESSFFDKEKVERFASLPSKEVLLSQLCGVLKATVSNFARAVSLVAEQKAAGSADAGSSQAVEAVVENEVAEEVNESNE